MSAFFDTNDLYYLTQTLSDKCPAARRVVLAGGVISPQVLNEFADATRRKLRLSWDEIMEWREMILLTCEVVPMTGQSQAKALEIAQHHQLHIYDANIWAAAILAGCETLYSEERLLPFVPALLDVDVSDDGAGDDFLVHAVL